MGIIRKMFFMCIVAWCSLEGYSVNLPPRISLSIPEEGSVEGREIPLYIMIDCMDAQTVDERSFQLDGKPLTVDRYQATKVAPEGMDAGSDEKALVVNRYRAVLPKRMAGVYNIGPVSAIVGGARYRSGTITLYVQAAVISKDFRLEAKVESPPKIFPGQGVVFEYKIFFQGSMQLLREDLPLLNVQGFLMVGSPEITTESVDKGYVQTIRQRAKAVTPGAYEIGVSVMEGMATQGRQQEARLVPPLYRAEAPSNVITVLPFPEANRPSIFDGALGAFVWRVTLLNGSTAIIGEPVHVEYRVSGRGDLDTVQFPSFDHLPSLTDSFWTDATPPIGEVREGTKRFVLTLRPKRLGVVNVPGFFTASFDPFSEQYLTTTVPPVKLAVEGSKEAEAEAVRKAPVVEHALEAPFEIDASTAVEREVSPMWIALACFGAVLGGILQRVVYRAFCNEKERKVTSRDLFYSAVKNRGKREKGLQLLRQALYLQLYERGLTSAVVDTPEEITGEGVVSEAKVLLQMLDRQLYKAGEPKANLQEIYDEASSLYYRIKQIQVTAEKKGEGTQ